MLEKRECARHRERVRTRVGYPRDTSDVSNTIVFHLEVVDDEILVTDEACVGVG
jgi:hypothetical protein